MKTEITEDEIQAFLSDPGTRSIAGDVLTLNSPFEVQSNGKVVRIHDYCGWEEYYEHGPFIALIATRGRLNDSRTIHVLNEIQELEQVDEFA